VADNAVTQSLWTRLTAANLLTSYGEH